MDASSAETDASTETLDELSGDEAGAPLRVHQLEEELVAKDELVTALTVQLEQLAEQLDRVQRSGADRKKSGGLPSDVVDGHRKLVGELERVVQQWEDMQAGLALGRIEVQLTELRDFVADRFSGHGGHFPPPSSHPALPTSVVLERISVSTTPAEPPPLTLPVAGEQASEPQPELPTMWESLKSRMLEESPSITSEDVTATDAATEELPPPTAINASLATPAELEQAVDERDAYIVYLLRKLRQQSAVQPAPDWVSLEHVPEQLCATLEGHTRRLEEMLRVAEIEMSIERARIGREQMQLRHQQDAIDKQMRRLGLKTIDEQAAESEDVSSADRRWVRFLGLPRGK